jgi:serine/threonine protein kinase
MNPPVLTVKSVFDRAHEITSPAERQAYLDEACAGDSVLRQKVEALLAAYEAIRSGSFLQTPAAGLGDTGPYRLGAATSGEVSLSAETIPPQPGTQHVTQIEGPGTQIGPYKLIKELGEGGMGAVYLAEQEQPIRRQVALKIIKPGMDSEQVIARFEAERQALTMMDHPNIARVFEAGTTAAGRPYFVMELVGGVPMTRFCNEHRLTIGERLQLFATVCEAIQHAHAKGVMHRDIKPGNVLVAMQDGKPVPKVIDFGLAKAIGQSLTDQTQLTQLGAIVGTLEYMSPEQADPSGVGVDTATDVYSLGVMLYELLTGTTPLDLATTRGTGGVLEVVLRIHEEDPPRPSARVAALGDRLATVAAERKTEPARLAKVVGGELDWIAVKALEKDRKRRYETASEFAKDVQRYLNDEPVEACPPTMGYRVGKFVRKNRVLAAFVALLMLAVPVLAWGLYAVNNARLANLRALTAEKGTRKAVRLTFDALRMQIHNRTKPGDAEKPFLRNMLAGFRELLRELGDAREVQATTAEMAFKVGTLYALLGESANAESNYRRAIELYGKLAKESKESTEYRNELARCQFDLAILLNEEGKQTEAESAYRQAIELIERVSTDDPAIAAYRSEAAIAYNNLGVLLRDRKEPAKAENALRQAIDLGEKVLVDTPDVAEYQIRLAFSYHNLANVVRDQGDAKAALSLYEKARKRLSPLKSRLPEAKLGLRAVFWDAANALGQLGQHAKASRFWQNAIALEDGTDKPHLQLFLAAEQVEEKLSAQSKPSGADFYEAAIVNARAKGAAIKTKEDSLEERYTKRALALLKQAQSAGWFRDPQRIKQLKEEKSFDSLPREEFNRFLESLDARTGTKDRPGKE